jgi:hypothetical protein
VGVLGAVVVGRLTVLAVLTLVGFGCSNGTDTQSPYREPDAGPRSTPDGQSVYSREEAESRAKMPK